MRPCKAGHFLVRALVIMLSLLCTGVRGQNLPGYSIDVVGEFSVQEGQCVTIPCTFMADYQTTFSNSRGYWMIDSKTAVARSKVFPRKFGEPRENFHFIGNPDEGNCTLTITDANKKDSGSYYFRFEGPQNYGYTDKTITVVVANLTDKPEIRQSGPLIAGKEATLTCIAPGNCPGASPSFQWKKSGTDEILGESSNLTFQTQLIHHQINITCKVKFKKGRTSAQKTLDVMYPPKQAEINISSSTGWFQYSGETVIIRDDEPLTMNCSADANPPATVIWMKGIGKDLLQSTITTDSSLEETYTCVAYNDYGSSKKTLKTILEDAPWKPEISIATLKDTSQSSQTSPPTIIVNKGDTITCLVNSSHSVNVIWQRGDNVLGKSTSRELSINVTQQESYRCVAWRGAEMTSKSIKINFPDTVPPANNAAPPVTDIIDGDAAEIAGSGSRIFDLLIGMLCGIVIVVAFIVLLKCFAKRRIKRKLKYSSPNENPPNEDAETEPNYIYMNVTNLAPISEDPKDEDPQEDAISLSKDQEDLHYSTIVFPGPPTGEINKQPETEYAEIKLNDLDE